MIQSRIMKRKLLIWLKFLIPTIVFYFAVVFNFFDNLYDALYNLVYRPWEYSEKWTVFSRIAFDLGYDFYELDLINIVVSTTVSTFTYLYFINKYKSKFQNSKLKQLLLFTGIWLIFMIISIILARFFHRRGIID